MVRGPGWAQWIQVSYWRGYRVELQWKRFVSSATSGVVMAKLRNVASDPVWAQYSFAL